VDNYDLVLEYLLSEGYSHKEATRIMVDEGIIQDLWKAAQKRFSSPKNIARAGAADVAATAIASTPANAARPALPPQPAPIVRTVAAPVTPNPLQQVAAPFEKVRNIVRQLNPAKPAAGSLPQGKPGGSVVTASKPGSVTPSAKPASGISNASGSSSVATRGSGGQVSPSGASVRTPGGPLAKAGQVVDVQSRPSGTPSVQRISPSKVRNFKPSVKVTSPTPAAVSGSTASSLLGALKYVPHVAAVAIGLNAGPVADGTLEGALERGDYKPMQGPPAPKEPEKKPEVKPEVKQVVTKKKVVTPVVKKPAPSKPVDSRLQKYRELIRQGRHDTARDLGRQIHADKFGIPTTPTRKTA